MTLQLCMSFIYYNCCMENSNNHSTEAQGAAVDTLENQLAQVEDALNGLRTSYAILSGYHQHLSKQYTDAQPSREEVES